MSGGSERRSDGVTVLLDRTFDLTTLGVACRAIRGSFPSGEVTEMRAYGFLAAINEGLISAIERGGGRGRVRLVRSDKRLFATVEDHRPTRPFDLPQSVQPASAQSGRGLWIVARSYDAARLEAGSSGLRLVMELAIH
jgi:serine/threonine-protein kinase RsbW